MKFIQIRSIILLLFSLPLLNCSKKNLEKSNKPAITTIYIEKLEIPNSPNPDILKSDIIKFIKHFMKSNKKIQIHLGGSKTQYSRPYSLELKWSLRSIEKIRPKIVNNYTHDRASEIGVEIIFRPLYPSTQSDILQAQSRFFQTFSSRGSKKLDKIMFEGLKHSISNALNRIWTESELIEAPVNILLEKLKDKELSIRKIAIDIVGKRKIKKAVPQLLILLKNEKYISVQMRIAGVLGILEDESTVEPLSDFALLLTPEHTISVLAIIGKIGGEKAKTFIYWMAQGHTNKTVRKAALKIYNKIKFK
jgi:hypothetical protein